MAKELTRDEAFALLKEYNKEPFHIQHGETVECVMRYFAQELGYGNDVEFWGMVGLLHDLDFELYPEQHCIKCQEIMKDLDLDEKLIHAVASHGYGIDRCRTRSRNGKSALCYRRTDRAHWRGCIDASFQERTGYGTEIPKKEIQRQILCCWL